MKTPNYSTVIAQILADTGIQIPYHTLRRRHLGQTKSRQKAHSSQQLLSPEAEQVLVDWITFYSMTANPLSRRSIRSKARTMCGKLPSISWIRSFLARWPGIMLGKPCGLDPKRAVAFNRPVVLHHFRLLDEIIKKYEIPVENIYNMDEKGCQRGGGRKASSRKYFVPRQRRPKYRSRSANLELVTIIECVCADGTSLLPGFVFSGTQYLPEWFEHVDDNIWCACCIFNFNFEWHELNILNFSISLSPNGWTDDFLCTEWFRKSFIGQSKARNKSGKPILLMLDGHGSHEKLIMIDLGLTHGIIIFCLPPHTTHRLQPLDVGVFGPFSRAWADRCDEIVDELGKEMPREDFVKEYMGVRGPAFKGNTIRKAFEKSGAWPVNSSIFTDEDYAPSLPTSTTTGHAPSSYPTSMPNSELDDDFYASDIEEQPPDLTTTDTRIDDAVDDDSDWTPDDEDDGDDAESAAESEPESSTVPLPITGEHAASVISDPFGLLSGLDHIVQQAGPLTVPPGHSGSSISQASQAVALPALRETRRHTAAALLKQSQKGSTEDLLARIADLEAETKILRSHCSLALGEVADLKRKINARENAPKKRRRLNVKARCLTSTEGRKLCEIQETARTAKELKKQEAAQRRQSRETEQQQRRQARDPTQPFFGALSSKNKPDLKQVADALQISADGTKQDILERITKHFDNHPEKKTDQLFEGLFNSRRRPRNDENVIPQASNQAVLPAELSILTTHPVSPSVPPLQQSGLSNIGHVPFPHQHLEAGSSQPVAFNIFPPYASAYVIPHAPGLSYNYYSSATGPVIYHPR